MAVQVINPGNKQDDSLMTVLGAAIGIAKDVYKVKMDDKQLARAEALKAEQLALEKIKEDRLATEKKSETDVAFARDFLPVPDGTKGALSIPGRAGLFLPRADVRAREANQTTLAAKTIDNKAKASDKDFTRTQALSNDYNKESKQTVLAIDGYKKLEASALNPDPTGATDVSLLIGFFKTLDPGSTVREGEFATAENAPGVTEAYRNMFNKVLSGQRLSPESRKQFLEEGKRLLQSRLVTQSQIDQSFKTKAENFNVDPAFVINQNFAKLKDELGELSLAGKNTDTQIVDVGGVKMKRSEAAAAALQELQKRKLGTASN